MESTDVEILTPDNVIIKCTNLSVRNAIGHPLNVHKVIVEHDGVSVESIFDAIFSVVEHLEFCPTNIKVQDNYITFNVQKCRSALERLFITGLVLQSGTKFLKMKIQLCDKKADSLDSYPMQVVSQMIEKRIKGSTLNLERFSKDFFGCEIYVLASNLKCIGNYIHHYFSVVSASRLAKIEAINLSGNGIKRLNGIQFFPNFSKLTHINLKNNLLGSVQELQSIRSYDISELWLDGNPLCQDFHDETSYTAAIKEYCQNLTKLDGVNLRACLPQFRRNFVCVKAAAKLVDQFMQHYFTVYDSSTRMNLIGLYQENALFSMSSRYSETIHAQSSTVSKYISSSRNILKLSDISRGIEHLHYGAHNICKFLESLPKTQHDRYTFAADLTQHAPDGTVLTITGMFRETPSKENLNQNKLCYNFCRTFRMKHCGNDEFRITNETLFITNITTEATKQFNETTPVALTEFNKIFGLPNRQEQKDMCNILQQITQMSESACRKSLEDSQWNIRESIDLFMKKYININKS